jgi:7-carboxy-7-deazaguanine synthase
MKIRLVKNGVFPITQSLTGELLLPETGFAMNGTLQGEGKLLGVPSLFVRLSGCNLRCTWKAADGSISICDTPYSSHYADEWDEWEVADVVRLIQMNRGAIKHIVISGGEPMLQAPALAELAGMLKKEGFHTTLETNATLFDSAVARYIDLISMSPKLSSAIPFSGKVASLKPAPDAESMDRHLRLYRDIRAIQKFIDTCYQGSFYNDLPDAGLKRRNDKDFQLKFVVAGPADIDEIESEYLRHLSGVSLSDVVLMPLGESEELLQLSSPFAAEAALRKGWRFTPRLQISLFGNKAGT